MDGWSFWDFLTYVTHHGFLGLGVNMSKPVSGGGVLCWVSQGSCNKRKEYDILSETDDIAAYVQDSSFAQFKERMHCK